MTVSKAQKKATSKWENKKYDKILVRLPKGTKKLIKQMADYEKISLNQFIKNVIFRQLIQQDLKQDNKGFSSCSYITSEGKKKINFSIPKIDTEKINKYILNSENNID